MFGSPRLRNTAPGVASVAPDALASRFLHSRAERPVGHFLGAPEVRLHALCIYVEQGVEKRGAEGCRTCPKTNSKQGLSLCFLHSFSFHVETARKLDEMALCDRRD